MMRKTQNRPQRKETREDKSRLRKDRMPTASPCWPTGNSLNFDVTYGIKNNAHKERSAKFINSFLNRQRNLQFLVFGLEIYVKRIFIARVKGLSLFCLQEKLLHLRCFEKYRITILILY